MVLSVGTSIVLLLLAGISHEEAGGGPQLDGPDPPAYEVRTPIPGETRRQQSRPPPARLYRWRDQGGTIHVSTDVALAPPHARALQLGITPVETPGDTLVESKHRAVPANAAANAGATPVFGHALDVYSVDGLRAVMANARGIAHALRDRDRLLDRLTTQL